MVVLFCFERQPTVEDIISVHAKSFCTAVVCSWRSAGEKAHVIPHNLGYKTRLEGKTWCIRPVRINRSIMQRSYFALRPPSGRVFSLEINWKYWGNRENFHFPMTIRPTVTWGKGLECSNWLNWESPLPSGLCLHLYNHSGFSSVNIRQYRYRTRCYCLSYS
jgi:hypothetical protein